MKLKTQRKKKNGSKRKREGPELASRHILFLMQIRWDVMDSWEAWWLIEYYFHRGFQNQAFVDFLNNRHAVTMKYLVQASRLKAVWHSLRLKHHIHMPRERITKIPRELNSAVHKLQCFYGLLRQKINSTGMKFGRNF